MTRSEPTPNPPEHLQPATKAWWSAVNEAFELEDHRRRLLTLAGEAWDRAEQARAILAEEGLTIEGRFQQCKVHPCVAVERDCALRFARLVRELQLDAEPEEVRPPRLMARVR